MLRRALLLTLLFLLPLAHGGAMAEPAAPGILATSASDPARDEVTCLAVFVCSTLCRDPAIDLRHAHVESDGTILTVKVSVQDISGGWMCPEPAIHPAERLTVRVFFQNCGGFCGPSLVVFRDATRVGTGVPGLGVHGVAADHCVIVNSAGPVCGVGSASDDTIIWQVPLQTTQWDIRQKCFGTVFAQGMAVPYDISPLSYLAASTYDFIDFRSYFCT